MEGIKSFDLLLQSLDKWWAADWISIQRVMLLILKILELENRDNQVIAAFLASWACQNSDAKNRNFFQNEVPVSRLCRLLTVTLMIELNLVVLENTVSNQNQNLLFFLACTDHSKRCCNRNFQGFSVIFGSWATRIRETTDKKTEGTYVHFSPKLLFWKWLIDFSLHLGIIEKLEKSSLINELLP